jgi:lipopolysaccharide transport system permease protein
MLSIYTLIFGFVMRARWANTTSTSDFALILFIGLIVFNFFSDVVNKAPTLITSQPNLVTKVVFPLEIFVWSAIGTALFRVAVSLIVWVAAFLLLKHTIHPSLLFLPLIFAPLALGIAGLAWFLASFGTFVRDTTQFLSLAVTGLMFLSPVFFDLSIVAPEYKQLFYINPITFFIEQARLVSVHGGIPDFVGLGYATIAGFGIAWAGLFWFQTTRHGFADVL